MNRREFLRIGGAAAFLIFLPINWFDSFQAASLEVAMNGILYRGTLDGKIYISVDQGKTWNLHTFLGPGYFIKDILSDRSGKLYIEVGFQHHSFFLALSNDRKSWETVT